jgi:hypothetical protein
VTTTGTSPLQEAVADLDHDDFGKGNALRLRRVLFESAVLFSAAWLPGCSPLPSHAGAESTTDLYSDPQQVEISGYDDGAEEPFVSSDGKYLFFNNQDGDKKLYFAVRTGPLSFRGLGELPDVNRGKLTAAPSLDNRGNFYFTSMRQYDKDFHSVFAGRFDGKGVTKVRVIGGNISPDGSIGVINMDVSISPDGRTMYISRARFGLFGGPPAESDLLVAHGSGDEFTLDPQSDAIMKNVNTPALEYAPAISADGRELYFTRADSTKGLRIMVATRATSDEPFGEPRTIDAISGFVEAPTLGPQKGLYFHKRVDGKSKIFRASRNPDR